MSAQLSPALSAQLSALAGAFSASRLVLFGSRARGDCGTRSDVDLAVYGLSPAQAGRFALELEELPTLLKFDLVRVDAQTAPALLENIEREGVVLYDAAKM